MNHYAREAREIISEQESRRKAAPVACALEDRAAELDLTLPMDAIKARAERESLMFHLCQYGTFDIPAPFRRDVEAVLTRLESLANAAHDLDVLRAYSEVK